MKRTRGVKYVPTVTDYLISCNPCIFLPTNEEGSALDKVKGAMRELGQIGKEVPDLAVWKITTGLLLESMGSLKQGPRELVQALQEIEKTTRPLIGVFYNLRSFITMPHVIQQLLDTINSARKTFSTVVIVGPYLELPPELHDIVTFCEFPLPTQHQLEEQIQQFVDIYEDDIQIGDGETKTDLVKKAAIAASGLSAVATENAVALSLSVFSTLDNEIIQQQKEQEIRKSDVLEFISSQENMNTLGGFDELKSWLSKRQRVFSDEARAYGLSYPKGVLLCGVAGCISGDTTIPIVLDESRSQIRNMSVEALYYRTNGLLKDGIKAGAISRYQGSLITPITLSINEKDKTFVKNKIRSVVFSGVKHAYELTTKNGSKIIATPDHEFLTPDNTYEKLENLKSGDCVVVRRKGRLWDSHASGRNRNIQTREIHGVRLHPYARRRYIRGLQYTSHPLWRLVIEAEMNSLRLEEYLYALNSSIEGLVFMDPDMEVHHKDRDRFNNTLPNLEVVTKEEHSRLHILECNPMLRFRNTARIDNIECIRYIGEIPTYDLSMEEPHRNFLANNIMVHNCGKSLCAKAIASSLELPLLRLDVGRIFSSLVGSSEARARSALKIAEAMSPAVLWLDELEKGLAGANASGNLDSGVTARVVATILTWRQETTHPVFVVATVNDPRSLPPMVYRKGRFDEIWAVDLPTFDERCEIFNIHIAKRRRNPQGFDVNNLSLRSEGFSGAEIESCIEDAMFSAFSEGEDITTEHILHSLSETNPQSLADTEESKLLREWIKTYARPVSKKEVNVKIPTIRNLKRR